MVLPGSWQVVAKSLRTNISVCVGSASNDIVMEATGKTGAMGAKVTSWLLVSELMGNCKRRQLQSATHSGVT